MRIKKTILLCLLAFCVKAFAWRVDYALILPGNSEVHPDVINYLIFSKELVNEQNEKMYSK